MATATAMNDEKLISLVQGHGCLYNSTHKHYNDPQKREKIWNEIGKALNQPGITCRTRWSNLRDQFRRANKTKRTLNGEASERKKWKFDKEMAFLRPYYHERSSVPNNLSDTDELVEATKHEGGGGGDTDDAEIDSAHSPGPASRKKQRALEKKDQDKVTKAASAELAQQQDETAAVRMEEEDITQSSSRPKSRPAHNQTIQRVQPIFKGPYYLQRGHGLDRERSHDVKRSTDHIDAFLFGIAETIKLFPPVYQHMAKNKIFNAVSELEMEVLMKSQVSSNLSDKGDRM